MAAPRWTIGSTFDRWGGFLSSPIEGRVVLGPNWFASVMGTGVIAVASATLPVEWPILTVIGTVAWALAAALLIVLLIVIPLHWLRDRSVVRSIANDPIAIQFFGAPPMALMTVGTATLLIGSRYIGMSAAVTIDWVLWICGTVLGLVTAILVPFRLFTQLQVRQDGAFGGWLMPVVPPMVSAAGARCWSHMPPKEWSARACCTCATRSSA
jgi:tellurite resistance protein TehA-like permease